MLIVIGELVLAIFNNATGATNNLKSDQQCKEKTRQIRVVGVSGKYSGMACYYAPECRARLNG